MEYLAAKRLLLVLDNCEHLLDAVAHQVDAIVHAVCTRVGAGDEPGGPRAGRGADGRGAVAGCPERRCRRRRSPERGSGAVVWGSGERGEERFRAHWPQRERGRGVVPAPRRHSVGARAGGGKGALDVTRGSRRPARSAVQAPHRGSRAALERHQTLRSTIDWSYDLLNPIERQALDRLSVFAGGCDLAAAEAVLAGDDLDAFDVDDVLGQLVDKSLVVADNDDDGEGALPAPRDHPPICPGTPAGERGHRGGSTPPRRTITWGYPRAPVRAYGVEITSSGLTSSRATPTTSALCSTGQSRHPRRSWRSAWSPLWRCKARPANSRPAGPRSRARSPAATDTRSFPWSPPGLRGAQRCALISSGPKTSSPSRNEPRPRSVHGYRP